MTSVVAVAKSVILQVNGETPLVQPGERGLRTRCSLRPLRSVGQQGLLQFVT
jgi:hypothetical protein